MAPGTEVIVEDLFYNVPARRKFLRSSGTESGHLCDVAEAVALANPPLSITVTRDGRKAREWLRATDRAERVKSVLVDEQLARCYGERGPLTIEAYLGPPERARAATAGLRLFCNGRPVRDRALLHSVIQAYGSVLERGRYPRGVVYVNLPPRLVDVNVHPQKSEVRFVDPRAVGDALFDVISSELQSAFGVPRGGRWATNTASASAPPLAQTGREGLRQSGPVLKPRVSAPAPTTPTPALDKPRLPVLERPPLAGLFPTIADAAAPNSGTNLKVRRIADSATDVRWGSLRFVAQLRNLYLICEGDEGLFVLDQHAAAERVQFHRLKQQFAHERLASQALLFPVTIQLEPRHLEAIEERGQQIEQLGFELRHRGESQVSIHQVPKLLQRADPARLVLELLDELARQGRAFSQGMDTILATMACHSAVRAGDVLTPEECRALLLELDGADFSGHCPHGRPIVVFTPWSELERRVGRR